MGGLDVLQGRVDLHQAVLVPGKHLAVIAVLVGIGADLDLKEGGVVLCHVDHVGHQCTVGDQRNVGKLLLTLAVKGGDIVKADLALLLQVQLPCGKVYRNEGVEDEGLADVLHVSNLLGIGVGIGENSVQQLAGVRKFASRDQAQRIFGYREHHLVAIGLAVGSEHLGIRPQNALDTEADAGVVFGFDTGGNLPQAGQGIALKSEGALQRLLLYAARGADNIHKAILSL